MFGTCQFTLKEEGIVIGSSSSATTKNVGIQFHDVVTIRFHSADSQIIFLRVVIFISNIKYDPQTFSITSVKCVQFANFADITYFTDVMG